jgi:hypothetical protein
MQITEKQIMAICLSIKKNYYDKYLPETWGEVNGKKYSTSWITFTDWMKKTIDTNEASKIVHFALNQQPKDVLGLLEKNGLKLNQPL